MHCPTNAVAHASLAHRVLPRRAHQGSKYLRLSFSGISDNSRTKHRPHCIVTLVDKTPVPQAQSSLYDGASTDRQSQRSSTPRFVTARDPMSSSPRWKYTVINAIPCFFFFSQSLTPIPWLPHRCSLGYDRTARIVLYPFYIIGSRRMTQYRGSVESLVPSLRLSPCWKTQVKALLAV